MVSFGDPKFEEDVFTPRTLKPKSNPRGTKIAEALWGGAPVAGSVTDGVGLRGSNPLAPTPNALPVPVSGVAAAATPASNKHAPKVSTAAATSAPVRAPRTFKSAPLFGRDDGRATST